MQRSRTITEVFSYLWCCYRCLQLWKLWYRQGKQACSHTTSCFVGKRFWSSLFPLVVLVVVGAWCHTKTQICTHSTRLVSKLLRVLVIGDSDKKRKNFFIGIFQNNDLVYFFLSFSLNYWFDTSTYFERKTISCLKSNGTSLYSINSSCFSIRQVKTSSTNKQTTMGVQSCRCCWLLMLIPVQRRLARTKRDERFGSNQPCTSLPHHRHPHRPTRCR